MARLLLSGTPPSRRPRQTASGPVTQPTRPRGHSSEPEDDGGDGDDGEVVASGLLIARRHAAELLELADAAFDEMTFLVEVPVEGQAPGAGGIARDNRLGAYRRDGVADVVGVIGGVGDDGFGGLPLQQPVRAGGVARLTGREDDAHRATEAAHGQVDLGGQAAAGAADGLGLSPPLAPAACWCARTMVRSEERRVGKE